MKNIIEEKSINENSLEILKRYFPNAIKLDDDGRHLIDSQALQLAIEPSKAKISEDGYGLSWVGKKEAYNSAYTKNLKILKPLKSESKDWENTGNILIKGDNIDVLKILRNNYHEKIKMIYIDPPYNTKNENFIYRDNFSKTDIETLEELGYSEKEDLEYIEDIYGSRTHSGWLSFMLPRLLLARDLLKDDGVIFISIDDNEVANLRLVCDEVFGAGNFVSQFVWRKRTGTNDATNFVSEDHEYILCYGKSSEAILNGIEKEFTNYKNPDNDPRGEWLSDNLTCNKTSSERPNLYYSITDPKTNITYECNPNRVWVYEKKRMNTLIEKEKILFPKSGKGTPMYKRHKSEVRSNFQPISSMLGSFLNANSTKYLRNLLEGQFFDYPKNIDLLKILLSQATFPQKEDLILDFFAGSGTTADAVMQLNTEDNGNRKFILVQIPQPIDEKKQKTSYSFVKDELQKEPTIFEITAERIRRAGEKILQNLQNEKNLLSEKIDLDIGFRVFETVEDKKQAIYQKPMSEATQDDLDIFTNPPKEDNDTILYNLLVAENIPLSSKIITLIPNSLFRVQNIGFILHSFELEKIEKYISDIEYLTIYSPNIESDKFSLELQSFVGNLGLKKNRLKFRSF